ncbi:amidase [Paenibacillus silagei]|uniref:Amidase n=1 Tax=Paenibacillus silagei TaxID=1670801 RepID=A0ABS4NSS4_9BACL|nr:amidase [Paenibacillus silagei]
MVLDNRYGAFRVPELEIPGSGHGALYGLTFTVKDVFAVAGHRSSAGNPDWLRSHEPAVSHAAAVRRLLEAGATLRGAAHTDELMYSLGGENYHYGTPVNPYGENRIPGGSSSGSAVAVASGSVDFALGTDTGGSIRVPSAYCGVFGYRPTHGAVSLEGVIPLAPAFDTVGWIAGSTELLLKTGRVLLGAVDSGGDARCEENRKKSGDLFGSADRSGDACSGEDRKKAGVLLRSANSGGDAQGGESREKEGDQLGSVDSGGDAQGGESREKAGVLNRPAGRDDIACDGENRKKSGDLLGSSDSGVGAQSMENSMEQSGGEAVDESAGDLRMSRMFILPEGWALVEQDCVDYLRRGLDKLQAGASLQAAEAVVAPEGLKTWMDAFRELQGAEIWATHGEWIGREQPVFGPDIAARFAWAAGLAGADHSPAAMLRSRITQRLRALLGKDGCLVLPTVPGPAPLRGAGPGQLERSRSSAMMLSCLAGLAGLPQVTLPVPGPGGLPLGLSVIGGHGQDLRLLSWIQEVWK